MSNMTLPATTIGAVSGLLAPALFFTAVFILGGMTEGYSHLSQTVSEIGAADMPMMLPWQISYLAVGVLFTFFGMRAVRWAPDQGFSGVPGLLLMYFGIVTVCLGLFPAPHPLHNLFGLALLPGYASPLVAAIAWRGERAAGAPVFLAVFSAAAVWLAIALNLSPIFWPSLYPLEYYGLVQRSLFIAFHGVWSIGLALAMLKHSAAAAWDT